MRFGFVTCVRLGLSCMEEIARLGGHFDLLVTLEDDRAVDKSGRVRLDDFAAAHGSALVKCRTVNEPGVVDAIRDAQLDWLFIIGWSQIAHREVLAAPKRGVLGIHPTLLPEGRGRAPIPWAIIKGLEATGVTLFQLDEGVDTGPVLGQLVLPIGTRETATTLYERVNDAHVELIREYWPRLLADDVSAVPQDHSRATTWPARRPEDGRFTSDMTIAEIDRLVRGCTHPYPGAFAEFEGQDIIVWSGEPVEAKPARSDGPVFVGRDGYFIADAWEARD